MGLSVGIGSLEAFVGSRVERGHVRVQSDLIGLSEALVYGSPIESMAVVVERRFHAGHSGLVWARMDASRLELRPGGRILLVEPTVVSTAVECADRLSV